MDRELHGRVSAWRVLATLPGLAIAAFSLSAAMAAIAAAATGSLKIVS